MDLAYDHLAEQAYNPVDRASTPTPKPSGSTDPTATPTPSSPRQSLQSEFQETFKAFSNSQWGARLGGFWGNVRKQGESLYEEAKKEASEMAQDMEALRLKAEQGLGFGAEQKKEEPQPAGDQAAESSDSGENAAESTEPQDTDTFLARFKAEAAKRLKEVQKAEDAADEALLRFGTNIRNFLRDAVSVTGPEDDDANRTPGEVLFESKDGSSGKRVIHTSRFDAQLHVIHTTLTSFTKDPSGAGGQWEEFKAAFNIDQTTSRIATDLEKYPELRSSMEKLVPDKVEYKDFWTRYYFLRHVVEIQEEKRKELLKGIRSLPDNPSTPQKANLTSHQRPPHQPKKSPGTKNPTTKATSNQHPPRRTLSTKTAPRPKSSSHKTQTTPPPRSTRRLPPPTPP
jgi:hypothetical protein